MGAKYGYAPITLKLNGYTFREKQLSFSFLPPLSKVVNTLKEQFFFLSEQTPGFGRILLSSDRKKKVHTKAVSLGKMAETIHLEGKNGSM